MVRAPVVGDDAAYVTAETAVAPAVTVTPCVAADG